MSSYYAFSSAWLGTIISFVLIGVFVRVDTFCESSKLYKWYLKLMNLDVDAWAVFFICVLLFQGLSNVALCILRYRLGMANAGSLALRQMFLLRKSTYCYLSLGDMLITSLVLHYLLFGIITTYRYSFDSSPSRYRHEVSLPCLVIDIRAIADVYSWSTTSKSVEKSNFFKQLPKIFKGFWPQIVISASILVGSFHLFIGT